MISVGDICVIRQTGSVLWAAKAPAPDPTDRERWTFVGKAVDRRGRAAYSTRVAGVGDVTVVRPWDAEVHKVGSEVLYRGARHLILEDRGANLWLGVAPHDSPRKGGGVIHIQASNTTVASKADVVLESIGRA
jgi:hypothetical protein